jgi:hypothetical protein
MRSPAATLIPPALVVALAHAVGCDLHSNNTLNSGLTFTGGIDDDGCSETGSTAHTDDDDDTDDGGEMTGSDDGAPEPDKFDLLEPDGGVGPECNPFGCKQVDVVFVAAGDAANASRVTSLAMAATGFMDAFEAMNCEGVDYRIGVTDGFDGGWIVPGVPLTDEWPGAYPWYDSTERVQGFPNQREAANSFMYYGITRARMEVDIHDLACDHPLASAVGLLGNDATGFLRPEALLVVVVVTNGDELDDFADVIPSNTCADGCGFELTPPSDLVGSLVALKGGSADAVQIVIVASEPGSSSIGNIECGSAVACGNLDQFIETYDPESGVYTLAPNVTMQAPRIWALASALPENVTLIDACDDKTEFDGASKQALVDAFEVGGVVSNACTAMSKP